MCEHYQHFLTARGKAPRLSDLRPAIKAIRATAPAAKLAYVPPVRSRGDYDIHGVRCYA